MANYTSADGLFSSDDPNAINEYNRTHTNHNTDAARANSAQNEFGYTAKPGAGAGSTAPGYTPNIGVAFGGSNPGTQVPTRPGLTVGPDGQVHDLTGAGPNGGGTATQSNAHAPNFGTEEIGVGTDNTGNVVVNNGTGRTDPGMGNANVGNLAPKVFDTGNTTTTNTVGSPHTAPGTLVPGGANVSDLTHRDPRDFEYGRTPGYGRDVVGQARTQAAGFGAESRAQGQVGADIGTQFGTQAAAAGQRGQEVGAGTQQALSAEAQLAKARGASLGQGLTGLEQTQGPSAAQAQLASATSQGMGDALTLARSGRGLGGGASAVAQAGQRMPGMAASAANQSSALAANENALWRARQAANMGTAAQVEQRGIDQSIGALQAGGQAGMAGTAQGMQGAQAGGQLGLAGNAAQQGATQNAQGQFWQGESLADKVTGAQTQQDLAYENMLTQEKGINAGIAINAANNEQSIWPAVIGAGATGLAMMASDERNKDVGPEVKLSSSIHGNPYGRTGAPGKMKGPMSDLSPYGSGPMGGQQNYAAAQQKDQELAAAREAQNQARLQGAIKAAGGIAQQLATPRQNNGAAGQAMVNQAMSYQMQPVVSDERSKNKIDSLESELAAARGQSAPDFSKAPNYAYTYKDPTIPGAASGTQVGPMAQDLEKAGSAAVIDSPTGKMVDPSRLAMETAGAVGEQQARQDDLERQFAELAAMLKTNERKPGGRSSKVAAY